MRNPVFAKARKMLFKFKSVVQSVSRFVLSAYTQTCRHILIAKYYNIWQLTIKKIASHLGSCIFLSFKFFLEFLDFGL